MVGESGLQISDQTIKFNLIIFDYFEKKRMNYQSISVNLILSYKISV